MLLEDFFFCLCSQYYQKQIDHFKLTKLMNVHLETDSTLSLYFVFGLLLISLDWERDLHCWKEPNKAIDEAPFFNKTKSFRCQKNFSFTMQWVEILLQILVQIIGTSYTITQKSRLTAKKWHKKTDAIFSIYGRTGIIP